MTKREAVVIETFTGICMLTGEDRDIAYKYAEELLGRPVFTHEYANPTIAKRLKELSKPEFIKICTNFTDAAPLHNDATSQTIDSVDPIGIDMCTCPKCDTYNDAVVKRRNTVSEDVVYCWHCGQKISVKPLSLYYKSE